MGLAVWLGRFLGAILAECGPALADILYVAIRRARDNTVEDSTASDVLRERLLKRLRDTNNPS